jgi:3-dehydroquinate synthase
MITVPVTASKNYDVRIGAGLLAQSGGAIREVCGGGKAMIVSDDIVSGLYGDAVEKSLTDAGFAVTRFDFRNGEQSKNITTYTELLNALCLANLTRSDTVVALGGGVVGDLAGFAAATYLRGVRFVQIPTTLLAMVDSSVGGKTGVNLESGKNQVGAFYQPDLVICDYKTLDTLAAETFADGCAEIIKHAAIKSAELFKLLSEIPLRPDSPNIADIIARNVTIKRDVVALDERDTGIRQILNFGHTLGHAIEKISDYGVSHGSAVAIGMMLESRGENRARIRETLERHGLPTTTDIPKSRLLEAAFSDKKRAGSKITVVELGAIGECALKTIALEELDEYYDFPE